MSTQDGIKSDKLSVPALTAMVVGSMVGAGVFTLPQRFASQTGVYGAVIAWAIAGAGMLMLAFVFQSLAIRKPKLDNGVYVYARQGFGVYPGFLSAFGFWASACAGNTFYWILISTTIAPLFPAFTQENGDVSFLAIAVSSVFIWGFFLLIRRGIKEAAGINAIVTVAKLLPLLLFVIVAIFVFKPDVFIANLTGGYDQGGDSLFEQVSGTMLVTVFVFLGIEGASVYSRFAKKREDVGRATVLGFLVGAGPVRDRLDPVVRRAAAGGDREIEPAVGRNDPRGSGHPLGWVVHQRRAHHLGARRLSRLEPDGRGGAVRRGQGQGSAQVPGEGEQEGGADQRGPDDHDLHPDPAGRRPARARRARFPARSHPRRSRSLPFLLAAGYALKIAVNRDGYADVPRSTRTRELVIGAIAVIYTLFLIFAAGPVFLLLACILLAPGTLLYAFARREQNGRLFTVPGWIVFVVVVVGAILGIVGIATGWIDIFHIPELPQIEGILP